MDFRDEMSQKIGYWLDSRRNASLQVLSRLSGVSYSTLRRIEQKEVHASLENTLQLLAVLTPREEAHAFLKRHFPDLGFLSENPSTEKEKQEPERREEFLLQALASNRQGMSEGAAKKRVGESARELLDGMCRKGLLTLRDNRYFAARSREHPSRSVLYLTWLLELFDPRPVEGWGSFAKIRTAGLSVEAVKEVHRIFNDTLYKIDSLLQDPANCGPHVIGYGLFSTVLGPSWELNT